MSAQIFEFPQSRRRQPGYQPDIPVSEARIAAEYRQKRLEHGGMAVICFLLAGLMFFIGIALFYVGSAGDDGLALATGMLMSVCMGVAITTGNQHAAEYRTLELEYRHGRAAEGYQGRG